MSEVPLYTLCTHGWEGAGGGAGLKREREVGVRSKDQLI